MALAPVITRGFGSWGSSALVITRGYGAAVLLSQSIEGLQFTLAGSKAHFTLPANRLHFTLPANRLHYDLTRKG